MSDAKKEIVPGMESGEVGTMGGRKVRGATAKNLKKMLKAAGLKTTGRKAALTRRAKKAHLKIRGGAGGEVVEGPAMTAGGAALSPAAVGGRRRSRRGGAEEMAAGRKRSRRSRKFLGVF